MFRARSIRHFVIAWIKRLVVAAVLVVAVVGGLSLYVGRTEPQWYQPPAPDDEEVATLADRVEYRIVEEAQKIRPDEGPWILRVRESQVNAWLGTRLQAWIAHEQGLEWPEHLGTPQAQILDHAFHLALPVGPPGHRRVLVGRLVPAIENGALTLRLRTLGVGRLVLPGDPVEALARLLDEGDLPRDERAGLRDVLDLLAGRRSVEPILELSDGRRVEVLDIHCHTGAVDLTSRTLKPIAAGAGPPRGPSGFEP
jgi:hypothetical protein